MRHQRGAGKRPKDNRWNGKHSCKPGLDEDPSKLAYEARKLVKGGRGKYSFVWDGKIFVTDHIDKK